jgi:hypothetical protein
MDAIHHRRILEHALSARLSRRALTAVYRANIGQDSLRGLFGHPEYHFDENAIAASLAYMEECRAIAARADSPAEAWAAFGRLTHAAQDFYAHSNYVRLWVEQVAPRPDPSFDSASLHSGRSAGGEARFPVNSIDGLDPGLLQHPRLMTCRLYWPFEALSFIPGLGPLIQGWFPTDSHARLNLDNPRTGRLFPLAMEAAVQRTLAEFERTVARMGEERGEEAVRAFCDNHH